MNKSAIKSQIKINEKNEKKYFGVLRRLAEFDSSMLNKIKVTVYKEDIVEEKKQIIIAPSIFANCPGHLINNNSIERTNENTIEDLIIENENPSPANSELMNYPDSSDFDDDDE